MKFARLLMGIGSALAAGSALAGPGCGAFDRLDAPTQAGWCAAVVAGQSQGLRMPRTVLWMSGAKGTRQQLLVVDMGSWEPGRGRLVQLDVDTATGQVQATELLNRLDRPHGLRLGPDGRVYLAEATRILRFAWPPPGGKAATETVVDKLPAQGRHPLKEIAFAPDGSLYINVGAATDRCDKPVVDGGGGRPQCPDAADSQPQAAVYRARFSWPQGKLEGVQAFAVGLRNSMALAVHASGTVWQAENNIDFDDAGFPAEEVNKLVEGGHYGWPGCVEARKPLTGVPKAWCANTIAPALLMPAHAAPLHMEFSRVGAEPPSANRVGMLVSWHGYRVAGRRLVRYETGADGAPQGKPIVLLGPWVLDGKSAARPGAPTGWAEDSNGQLWIADDRNRMLIWLRRNEEARR